MARIPAKLTDRFYNRANVCKIARELLGKVIVTNFGGLYTSARIVETEAYAGEIDRASHAFGGRRTVRTEPMYGPGGISYVYLCYGIHHLFNIVTNARGVPHAILVRAAEPLEGIPAMLSRTGKAKADHSLTRGPGNVSRALGITTAHTNMPLSQEDLFIADDGFRVSPRDIVSTARIGVGYAGEDALLPYRFYVAGNLYVSGRG